MPHNLLIQGSDDAQNTMRCVVDNAGKLVFVSPALGWSLGHPAAALTGRPITSVLDILNHPGLEHIESGIYEVALLREGNTPLLVPARIDRIETPGGKNFTIIWCDPENKQQDTKPAPAPVTSTDARHFLDLTDDLFVICGTDLHCADANESFLAATGRTIEELENLPFTALFHPDDRAQAAISLHSAKSAPTSRVAFEGRLLAQNGATRRIGWNVKVADGKIYAAGHDLTALREQQDNLLRREQQISEAQKVGSAGHWSWKTDADMTLKGEMNWSEQVYAIFGVGADAFTPAIANVRAMILKRDIARIARALQRAQIRKKDYAFEFRLRRPSGRIRYVRCEGRCRLNPQTGNVEALYGIIHDVTDRTLHEKALRTAKEAAEQAYASKTRFLANMSHELRTPLNAIIGFSEMIQRQLLGPVGNPRYLDYVGSIRDSGDHLLDLINDILDMSKIEAGKYELHTEELNVGKTIRLAVHMIEGRATEGQVRVLTDGIENDIQITADRRALMQILLNIISNAVKFTKAGGTVDIRCHREMAGVAIVVSDTGIGIPQEKIALVTRPFEQVDSEFTRRYDGTGLGLAITKDLIELHGGTLEINSEINQGTVVSILLPETPPVRN